MQSDTNFFWYQRWLEHGYIRCQNVIDYGVIFQSVFHDIMLLH